MSFYVLNGRAQGNRLDLDIEIQVALKKIPRESVMVN